MAAVLGARSSILSLSCTDQACREHQTREPRCSSVKHTRETFPWQSTMSEAGATLQSSKGSIL